MVPEEFYKARIADLKKEKAKLNKKKSILEWLRLAGILVMATAVYLLLPYGIGLAITTGVALLIVFLQIVAKDLANKSSINHLKYLIALNKNELDAINHHYHHFKDGIEWMPKEHLYANDLDIFGHASVFQFINRTTSETGSETLANWLLSPAGSITILQRQEAVKELTTQTKWRQQLQGLGAETTIQKATVERLNKWMNEGNIFITNKVLVFSSYFIPISLLAIIGLNIADIIDNYTRNYFLLIAAVFTFYIMKKITPLHTQVSKMTHELEVLTNSIQLIETIQFSSTHLRDLQSSFSNRQNKASTEINRLKKILERLDLRFNFIVFIPLDILLQWDLQQAIALEKWKKRNQADILQWFQVLAEFEALNSLATVTFNNPGWCFPLLKEDHFFIEGKNIGHPLIKPGTCVCNPVYIEHAGKLMLITGSNMAGKSTYLRSIGVNTVLAAAGGPVCAEYFCFSPVQVVSSMRIADNLNESTSTFYAELKKLKIIIEKVNNHEKVFILLDEILRGTNSLDRHTGSVALVKQLIKQHAACIVATHDVELARLENEFPGSMVNYHFDVQVAQDELYFDYCLKEGVCQSLNASILMKKIGIEL